jgi:GNAT superfamily N-acetyltransferase
MEQLVRETFLEMKSASEANPLPGERRLTLQKAEVRCPEIVHFFYRAIGADWGWYDRVTWSQERWHAHAHRPDLSIWIATTKGCPAGYVEFILHPADELEIRSLGLLPTFLSQGLGKELLASTLEIAWDQSPSRLWLSTCSLDHPRALPNYQAAGFKIFKTKEALTNLPDHSLSLWPTTAREDRKAPDHPGPSD